MSDIDGALIGGASLDAQSFLTLAQCCFKKSNNKNNLYGLFSDRQERRQELCIRNSNVVS
jgi:hypothetical protein